MSNAICPHCRTDLACLHCRNPLSIADLANLNGPPLFGTDTGEPTSSSGRQPMWAGSPRTRSSFTDQLGEHGRSAYLKSVDDDGTPGFISLVARDDELVAACELDQAEAHAELREARAYAPEQPQARALSPVQEQAWRRAQNAEVAASRADGALEQARARLARSLADYERVAAPTPSWFDGEPGLSAIDRDRR